jgi:hypothetical protein
LIFTSFLFLAQSTFLFLEPTPDFVNQNGTDDDDPDGDHLPE